MKRPLVCTILGLLLMVASFGFLSGATASSASAVGETGTPSQLAAVGAPPCPAGWTCQAMPCLGSVNCGYVEAGPTSNLGPDQWVYLNFYGLPASETVNLDYCQYNNGSLATPPLCAYESTETEPQPTLQIESLPNGTSSISFQAVEIDSSGGNCTGIPGEYPNGAPEPGACSQTNPTIPEFFCDTTGNNNCSIDLTVPGESTPPNLTPDAQNTLAIPVTFGTNTGACGTAKQVLSESEFGFQQIFQTTDQLTCGQAGSAIPFNTEIDGISALQALDQGSIQMAFTDDPQSADQQAIIKKDNLLLIPIAYSANAIGDRAEMRSPIIPQTGIKLTATLAAGIIGGIYFEPSNSETANCVQGSSSTSCGVMQTLNYVSGFGGSQSYLSFLRSDGTGSTEQLLSWICASKEASVSLTSPTTETLTETQSAEQVLIDGLFAGGGAPSKGCLTTDQLPPFISQAGTATAYSTPGQQTLKLAQNVLPPGSATAPSSGFAPMNWAESSYYGLDPALLQNAAGQFVGPTPTSVNAGIGDGSWSNGMWTPNYANASDAAAYAMPTVMYAVVPRAADITAADKSGIQASLNAILAVTGATPKSASLPEGILPLSADVAVTSRDEVANGVGNPNYVVPAIGSATPSGQSGSGTSFGSGSSFGSGGSFAGAAPTAAASSSGAGGKSAIPSSSPTYGPIWLTASESRLLLPATVSLGALLALIGIVMMSSSGLSQRRAQRAQLKARSDEANPEEVVE